MTWTVRRGVLLLLPALLVVGACGADADAEPEGVAEGVATTTARTAEEVYLASVKESGYVDEVSDEALLTAGREVCSALDRGVEPIEVLGLAAETSVEVGASIMGTAVGTLCREHLDAVDELATQLG